jgi:hypothetical protein
MSDLTTSELDLVVFLRRGMLVPAIAIVAKLGIPDLVDAGPKQAGELAAATGAHAPSLYRLLRTLAGAGLFNEDEQGRFALTPSGAGLRRGGAARELALVFGAPFIWAAWGKLEHSVLTGESAFAHAHRLPLFEYLQQSPEADAVFHAWMTRQSELQIPGILAAYDFSRFRRVVDIGGGRGALRPRPARPDRVRDPTRKRRRSRRADGHEHARADRGRPRAHPTRARAATPHRGIRPHLPYANRIRGHATRSNPPLEAKPR